MWLFLYAFGGAVLVLTYLKIGDFIARKGHRVWRRRRLVEDRLWPWLLFPAERAGWGDSVDAIGQILISEDVARSPTCPHWYRITLAVLWPVKLAVNALCWTVLLAQTLVIFVVRLLCGLVMLAIDPKEAGRRLAVAFRGSKSANGDSPRRTVEPVPLELECPDEPPAPEPSPAEDPLYPRGRAPDWMPDPNTDGQAAEMPQPGRRGRR